MKDIDFDPQELHDIVLKEVTELEEKFKCYEVSHGLNFAGSLCATLASEMLVRLVFTSPNVESAADSWKKVVEAAAEYTHERATYQLLMTKIFPGKFGGKNEY